MLAQPQLNTERAPAQAALDFHRRKVNLKKKTALEELLDNQTNSQEQESRVVGHSHKLEKKVIADSE